MLLIDGGIGFQFINRRKREQMVLDSKRKENLSSIELGAFFGQTSKVKAYERELGQFGKFTYTIFKDERDPDAGAKAMAVHEAVKKIVGKGVGIPKDLRVYCTSAYEAQNRAFHRDMAWKEVAWVILGSAALKGGRSDALSASGLAGCDKPTITCIHEIGHNIHEKNAGDAFWELTGTPTNSNEVSGYAGQNKKEFVAEVFAGVILGKVYSKACMDEYASYGGPPVP
jgi:hypothetical protein